MMIWALLSAQLVEADRQLAGICAIQRFDTINQPGLQFDEFTSIRKHLNDGSGNGASDGPATRDGCAGHVWIDILLNESLISGGDHANTA